MLRVSTLLITHLKESNVRMPSSANITKKTVYYVLFSKDLIYSIVYSFSSWFEKATIVALPRIIRMNEGKSYLQIKFSFRKRIERIVLNKIPYAVIVESSTKSANGRTAL